MNRLSYMMSVRQGCETSLLIIYFFYWGIGSWQWPRQKWKMFTSLFFFVLFFFPEMCEYYLIPSRCWFNCTTNFCVLFFLHYHMECKKLFVLGPYVIAVSTWIFSAEVLLSWLEGGKKVLWCEWITQCVHVQPVWGLMFHNWSIGSSRPLLHCFSKNGSIKWMDKMLTSYLWCVCVCVYLCVVVCQMVGGCTCLFDYFGVETLSCQWQQTAWQTDWHVAIHHKPNTASIKKVSSYVA